MQFVADSESLENMNTGCKTACTSAGQSEVDGTPLLGDCHLACLTTHSPSSVASQDARGGCQAGCALINEFLQADEIAEVREELASEIEALKNYTDAEIKKLRDETEEALMKLNERVDEVNATLVQEIEDRKEGDTALEIKLGNAVAELKNVCFHSELCVEALFAAPCAMSVGELIHPPFPSIPSRPVIPQ